MAHNMRVPAKSWAVAVALVPTAQKDETIRDLCGGEVTEQGILKWALARGLRQIAEDLQTRTPPSEALPPEPTPPPTGSETLAGVRTPLAGVT